MRRPATAEQWGGGQPAYPIIRVTDSSHYDSTLAYFALDVGRKEGLTWKLNQIHCRKRDCLKEQCHKLWRQAAFTPSQKTRDRFIYDGPHKTAIR
ncbi:hypothetical protein AMECASPLE_007058 [Ameca splendens]|uniref:Uncharacterized protein n=1 Tax=Ameca splendens TaxID=208324 RepID=A0ABV0XZZ3_9TELE